MKDEKQKEIISGDKWLIEIYQALKEAKETIKLWHNMGQNDVDKMAWNIYQNSPEMRRINQAIDLCKKLLTP